MAKRDHEEYKHIPYPIANTEGLYRVLVETGGTTKNPFESLADYCIRKGEPIPEDIAEFLSARRGTRTNEGEETQAFTYAYEILRRPEGMTEEEFKAIVRSEFDLPGSPIRTQATSRFAVTKDLFSPTVSNFVSADKNGFLLLRRYGTNLDDYYTECGNVLINGRRVNKDKVGAGDVEETGCVDSIDVLDELAGHAIIYPADENGFYPVTIGVTKGSRPDVSSLAYNWISPTGEYVCQDFRGERVDVVSDGTTPVVNRFVSENGLYFNPIVTCVPGKKPRLFPTATHLVEECPMLADKGIRNLAESEAERVDTRIEEYGEMYDDGLLSDGQYNKAMEVLGRTQDYIMAHTM